MKLWKLIKWGLLLAFAAVILYVIFLIGMGALIILLPFM